MATMSYRRLGHTGLQVSVLGYGAYASFGNQADAGRARACMEAAYEGGINFFDNAESYAAGEAERIMGRAFETCRWPRDSYVVSTKAYIGTAVGANRARSLNRKFLMNAIDRSLERLDLDFVDVFSCHRPDPNTPIEETVWAMHAIVDSGRALYWGTSEWPIESIRTACEVARRDHLYPPVTEQLEYSIRARTKVEEIYAQPLDELGVGITTWSPLAGGILTGKYVDGTPDGSRAALRGVDPLTNAGAQELARRITEPDVPDVVAWTADRAATIGCSAAQFAISWCVANPVVSCVITGASRPEQIEQNLGALDVLECAGARIRGESMEVR